MQDLIELIQAINITRIKSSGLWPVIFEEGSLMEKLCIAINEGKINSDEDAIALFYPGEAASSKFINLRERLKERLVSVVFLLEFRAAPGSNRQKAYVECNQKWAAAMILNTKNAKRVSVGILEDMLKTALHYEFTDLTLNALSHLRQYYGVIKGDLGKYNLYRDMYRKYQEIWLAENEAEDAYTYLASQFVKSKASNSLLAEEAEKCFEQIQPHMAESDSFRLHLCARLVQVMIYTNRKDYVATAKICVEALAFFKKKEFESTLPLQAFYYQLILCYIHLQEFEKGEATITMYQSAFEEGSFNWFKLQELFFLLAMYTKRYTKAFNVNEKVQQKLRQGVHPVHINETWKIHEAYIEFLIHIKKINPPIGYNSKFKLSRFLNEIPTFSKDKQGMNIPILIIHILFNIAERNFHRSIDRIETIEKYCSRYLKQNETYRSSCYIKALLQFPAASFHPEAVRRKAGKYIAMLEAQPLKNAYQSHEIEIIPYEHLWEMALETLADAKGQRAVMR